MFSKHFGLYCYDDGKFHAFVKLDNLEDVELAQATGLSDKMRDFVSSQLDLHGRGSPEATTVEELDYHKKSRNPVPFDLEARMARAKVAMQEYNKHLDEVTTLFNERFRRSTTLDFFAISGVGEKRFGAAIFFRRHDDISEAERRGLDQEMMDYVYELLRSLGEGSARISTLSSSLIPERTWIAILKEITSYVSGNKGRSFRSGLRVSAFAQFAYANSFAQFRASRLRQPPR